MIEIAQYGPNQVEKTDGILNDNPVPIRDMARKFGDDVLIYNWMRNRNTLEFIGIWEQIHNPAFKGLEFDRSKSDVLTIIGNPASQ